MAALVRDIGEVGPWDGLCIMSPSIDGGITKIEGEIVGNDG